MSPDHYLKWPTREEQGRTLTEPGKQASFKQGEGKGGRDVLPNVMDRNHRRRVRHRFNHLVDGLVIQAGTLIGSSPDVTLKLVRQPFN